MSYNDSIERALEVFSAGRPIIVIDDESRENEGDVVVAAEFATPQVVNFMAREARGLVCVAMSGADLDRLGLALMVATTTNGSRFGSPFTVSVDASRGVSTGISAFDRARTIQVLVDPRSGPADLTSPGHIFPLRAHDGGVLARRGHTEAGVDLARATGRRPAAVICEIMSDDGTMARREDLTEFGSRHNLPIVTIDDVARLEIERPTGLAIRPLDTTTLPTRFGTFRVTAFRDAAGVEHLAMQLGDLDRRPLVRLHSECLTGDVLGSLRCDCGDQLHAAMERIARRGSGLILYMRQEGRGIGLANKIRAYALQDQGLDTVEANLCLGFSPDLREYDTAAAILHHLDVASVRLMTNNPKKVTGLTASGIGVEERVPLLTKARPENERYLATKAHKMDHQIELTGT